MEEENRFFSLRLPLLITVRTDSAYFLFPKPLPFPLKLFSFVLSVLPTQLDNSFLPRFLWCSKSASLFGQTSYCRHANFRTLYLTPLKAFSSKNVASLRSRENLLFRGTYFPKGILNARYFHFDLISWPEKRGSEPHRDSGKKREGMERKKFFFLIFPLLSDFIKPLIQEYLVNSIEKSQKWEFS